MIRSFLYLWLAAYAGTQLRSVHRKDLSGDLLMATCVAAALTLLAQIV